MTRTLSLSVVLSCVLLLAWATGSSRVAVPRAAAPGPQARALMTPDPAIESIPRQAVRLRQHLSSVAPLPPSRRNPFLFREAAASARARAVDLAAAAAASAAEPAPRHVDLLLVGIAEDPSELGATRRAIVSAAGELVIVREGERVLGRYEVVRIGADAIELKDGSDRFTLALR